jgi:hypothetical protein
MVTSRLGLVALVAANLAVALITSLRGWGYYEALLVFWFEAVVLGGYNVLRLLVVGFAGERPLGDWMARHVEVGPGARIFFTLVGTLFFIVKFGGFALVVGIFAIALPASFAGSGDSGGASAFRAFTGAAPGVAIAVGLLVASHGVSFVRNFLGKREYARLDVLTLIVLPYVRMSAVALVLGLGLLVAQLFPGARGATAFAVVMVLVKTAADAAAHEAEHGWLRRRSDAPAGLAERRAEVVGVTT